MVLTIYTNIFIYLKYGTILVGMKCWKSRQCVLLRHFKDNYEYIQSFNCIQANSIYIYIYVLMLKSSFVYMIDCKYTNFTAKTSCESPEFFYS